MQSKAKKNVTSLELGVGWTATMDKGIETLFNPEGVAVFTTWGIPFNPTVLQAVKKAYLNGVLDGQNKAIGYLKKVKK